MTDRKEDPVDACIRVLGEEIRRMRGAVERTGRTLDEEARDERRRTG